MAIGPLLTGGLGNGTFDSTIALLLTEGLGAGPAVAATGLHGRPPRYWRPFRDFDEFLRRQEEQQRAEGLEIAAREAAEQRTAAQRRLELEQRRRDIERYQQQQLAAIDAALEKRVLAIAQAEAERSALAGELALLMATYIRDQENETLFLLLAAA